MEENPRTPARVRLRSKVPDERKQAAFIDLLRQGVHHVAAARAVGSTSSRFTALEGRDRAFRDLVAEATEIGGTNYRHAIRGTIRDAASNPRHPNHWRAVERQADALLPEYEYKRTTRIGNAPGEELAIGVNARIPADVLEALDEATLNELIRAKEIERALERGEPIPLRAIEGGSEA